MAGNLFSRRGMLEDLQKDTSEKEGAKAVVFCVVFFGNLLAWWLVFLHSLRVNSAYATAVLGACAILWMAGIIVAFLGQDGDEAKGPKKVSAGTLAEGRQE